MDSTLQQRKYRILAHVVRNDDNLCFAALTLANTLSGIASVHKHPNVVSHHLVETLCETLFEKFLARADRRNRNFVVAQQSVEQCATSRRGGVY